MKLIPEDRENDICNLYTEGWNGTDIAKKFNYPSASVYYILRKKKIPLRNRVETGKQYKLMLGGERKCPTCLGVKQIGDFAKDKSNKSGYKSRCKPCHARFNSGRVKNLNAVLRRHKLQESEYLLMLAEQDNCCAICEENLVRSVIDHCHKTGKIRGILCYKCNHGLGAFCDNGELLKKAIAYVNS